MGACAIYTAIPDASLVEDVLACVVDDIRDEDRRVETRGLQRFGLGRLAVMALAEAFMPASHRELARTLHAKCFYGAFAPAMAHHPGPLDDHKRFFGIDMGVPLWPTSPALATIIGCAPARYHGWHRRSTHGVAVIDRDVVAAGLADLRTHDLVALPADDFLKTREVAVRLIAWLAAARERGDCVVLHWELR